MASPQVLDIEKLLAPISDAQPTGLNPREDGAASTAHRNIRDARKQARDIENLLSRGEDGGGRMPDWGTVQDSAVEFLSTHAKDLDIAGYLTEALAREEGFAGLRDAFRLAREMVEKYWDNLHPMPDEEGMATRVAVYKGLNGEEQDGALIIPINNIAITNGSSGGFSRADYESAVLLESVGDPDRKRARIEAGQLSLQMFQQAVRETPASFYQNLVDDMNGAISEFDLLTKALEERCGRDGSGEVIAPPSSNISRALRDCLEVVQKVAKDKVGTATAAAETGAAAETAGGVAAGGAVQSNGTWDREAAFRRIQQLSEEFRRNDPQTLMWYALEQALRWGRMPLPELLNEFIPDSGARSKFEWLGIKAEPPADGSSS